MTDSEQAFLARQRGRNEARGPGLGRAGPGGRGGLSLSGGAAPGRPWFRCRYQRRFASLSVGRLLSRALKMVKLKSSQNKDVDFW